MKASDVAEFLEATVRAEFLAAVEHPKSGASEDVERKLYGLFWRATRGVASREPAPGQVREQWLAWAEFSGLSDFEAMRDYVDLVAQYWDFEGTNLRPPEKPKRPDDVFEAARVSLNDVMPFLPEYVNARDADGLTPLIHAVDAEKVDCVRVLLGSRANVNDADPEGSAPLHYAALLGNFPIAHLLVDYKADLALRDNEGKTPWDIATAEGHAALADLLTIEEEPPAEAK